MTSGPSVKKHFDTVAKNYDYYKSNNSYYYQNLKQLLSTLIPKGKNVLEVGCGTGDLLASLKPKMGFGMDISSEMIRRAEEKYSSRKNLHFFTSYPLTINHQLFDYIFMSDVIEHLDKPKDTFLKINKLMDKKTVFIITMANPIWEPVLMVAEKLGLKMPEGPHRRITNYEFKILIEKAGMKITKHDYKLLVPVEIPLITYFANRYLEKYLKNFAFIEYFVAIKI